MSAGEMGVLRVRTPVPDFIRLLAAFVRRLTVTDTTIAEFQSSTTFLAMSVLMLDPWPTLTAVNVPIFVLMLQIMSEPQWGVLFLVVGAGQSIVNLFGFQYGRKLLAFIAAVVWGLLFALGCMASPPSFFVPVCGVACAVQGLVYLRLAVMQEAIRRA